MDAELGAWPRERELESPTCDDLAIVPTPQPGAIGDPRVSIPAPAALAGRPTAPPRKPRSCGAFAASESDTERRWNRTIQAWGCHALPALKAEAPERWGAENARRRHAAVPRSALGLDRPLRQLPRPQRSSRVLNQNTGRSRVRARCPACSRLLAARSAATSTRSFATTAGCAYREWRPASIARPAAGQASSSREISVCRREEDSAGPAAGRAVAGCVARLRVE
jgi:hypothetical protein